MLQAILLAAVMGAAPPRGEVVTLPNGMRWLLLPRADAGRIAGVVAVRAGSALEKPGETGVAHMLEHLAFAGTPIVGSWRGWSVEEPALSAANEQIGRLAQLRREGKGTGLEARTLEIGLVPLEREADRLGSALSYQALLGRHGVRSGADTTKDRILYWGDFSSAQLHLWLAAEAQRFAAPVLRNFRVARDIVIQELRDRLSPHSAGEEALLAAAFAGTGYAWDTIGREEDLQALSPQSVDDFYARHVAPQVAVGCLVGDFDPALARAWLAETFALIPARPVEPPKPIAVAAPSTVKARADEPMVMVGVPCPSYFDAAAPAHAVLATMLVSGDGPLSRTGGRPEAFADVQLSWIPGIVEAHLVVFHVRLRAGGSVAHVAPALERALAGWEPSDDAVEAAKNALELGRLRQLRSLHDLSHELAEQLLFTGEWASVFEPRYQRVTREAVLAARAAFSLQRATTVELSP